MALRHFFARPPSVSADEAARLVEGDAVIVDVRGAREWQRHHVPGSVNIPLQELEARALELPEDTLLITFCTGGLLSTGAATLLTQLGFDAVTMRRGLMEWRAAGHPLEHDAS